MTIPTMSSRGEAVMEDPETAPIRLAPDPCSGRFGFDAAVRASQQPMPDRHGPRPSLVSTLSVPSSCQKATVSRSW